MKPFLSVIHSQICISDIKTSRNIKIPLYYVASVLVNNFVFLTFEINLLDSFLQSTLKIYNWGNFPKRKTKQLSHGVDLIAKNHCCGDPIEKIYFSCGYEAISIHCRCVHVSISPMCRLTWSATACLKNVYV